MSNVDACDVVVIGAGTAGLLTALGLARAGVAVEVLPTTAPERLPWTAVHHWSVLDPLHALGVLDEIVARGQPTSQWGLHVLATGETLRFDDAELGDLVARPFNVRLEQPQLHAILVEALVAQGNARIGRRCRVRSLTQDDTGANLELDDASAGSRALRARWVVGADGLRSAVRRHLGLGYEGTTWPERWVTALVEHDFAGLGYADTTFQVDGRLGAVVERAADGRWRYVFEESSTLPEESIGERIPGVLEQVTGRRSDIVDWTSGRMHQRSARSYRSGRVLLVGEAAHVTHPLVGRSPICGYFDAFSLADELVAVLSGTADEDALTDWAARRRRIFLDEVVPTTAGRKNLVTQIRDPGRLATELDQYRRAVADPEARRELLVQGVEPATVGPVVQPAGA